VEPDEGESEFADLGEKPRVPPMPLTGWQATYRIVKWLLFMLLPIAAILAVLIAVDTWTGKPTHDWRMLVQRDEEGDWKVIGEYADEGTCLEEARVRNEPKIGVWFACYSRDESPDDEEPIPKLLERAGIK